MRSAYSSHGVAPSKDPLARLRDPREVLADLKADLKAEPAPHKAEPAPHKEVTDKSVSAMEQERIGIDAEEQVRRMQTCMCRTTSQKERTW